MLCITSQLIFYGEVFGTYGQQVYMLSIYWCDDRSNISCVFFFPKDVFVSKALASYVVLYLFLCFT